MALEVKKRKKEMPEILLTGNFLYHTTDLILGTRTKWYFTFLENNGHKGLVIGAKALYPDLEINFVADHFINVINVIRSTQGNPSMQVPIAIGEYQALNNKMIAFNLGSIGPFISPDQFEGSFLVVGDGWTRRVTPYSQQAVAEAQAFINKRITSLSSDFLNLACVKL
ncbi:MAG: hypothetical protein ACK5ZE_15835 [Pseudanabaena sp.]